MDNRPLTEQEKIDIVVWGLTGESAERMQALEAILVTLVGNETFNEMKGRLDWH